MTQREPLRYDQPVRVVFGGMEIDLEPLRGLKALDRFERMIQEEIEAFQARLTALDITDNPHNPEHLLQRAINPVDLLVFGSRAAITEEMVANSTQRERLGVLCEILQLNGLGHLAVFVDPGTLLDIALRMRKWSDATMEDLLGPPEFAQTSSEPALAGGTSSTS